MAHYGTSIEDSEMTPEDGNRNAAEDRLDTYWGTRNQAEAFELGVESAIDTLLETLAVLWALGSIGD